MHFKAASSFSLSLFLFFSKVERLKEERERERERENGAVNGLSGARKRERERDETRRDERRCYHRNQIFNMKLPFFGRGKPATISTNKNERVRRRKTSKGEREKKN